jgi:hypothetical protein
MQFAQSSRAIWVVEFLFAKLSHYCASAERKMVTRIRSVRTTTFILAKDVAFEDDSAGV